MRIYELWLGDVAVRFLGKYSAKSFPDAVMAWHEEKNKAGRYGKLLTMPGDVCTVGGIKIFKNRKDAQANKGKVLV